MKLATVFVTIATATTASALFLPAESRQATGSAHNVTSANVIRPGSNHDSFSYLPGPPWLWFPAYVLRALRHAQHYRKLAQHPSGSFLDTDVKVPRLDTFVQQWSNGTTSVSRSSVNSTNTASRILQTSNGTAVVPKDAPAIQARSLTSENVESNPSNSSGIFRRSANQDQNQFCIDFTFDDPNYTFGMQYPWGSGTGNFGSLPNGRMCVPRHQTVGGAMFIGTHPNPIGGNTKLECFFPHAGIANCDMSLVDGFSLPVTCIMGDQYIGGPIDLWKTGAPCENKNNIDRDICLNTKEERSEDLTPAFFQPAIVNGHNYCIWTKCTQNPSFARDAEMKCHIGPSKRFDRAH